jgi:hypothetical protein
MTNKPEPAPDPALFPTALMASMVQMHEFYQSAISAGFSADQAFRLVLEMVRTAAATSSSDE